MAHPVSALGAIHTAISIVPVIAGLYAFVRHGKIDPARRSGRVYLGGLVLAVVTSFGVTSTGGLNAGHAFGIGILLFALGGTLVSRLALLGRLRPYLSTFGLSFSFLLSLVPATNESLTRFPQSRPLAEAPLAPVIQHTLLTLLVLFLVGFIAQIRQIRSLDRNVAKRG